MERSDTALTRRGLRVALLTALIAWASTEGAGAAEQAALSPDDAAAVRRAVTYLNDIDTLAARFVQVSSDGGFAEGQVLVARPGKLRFDYDPPHPVLMIANGFTFLFYDRELKQASFLPLWETPLWFLIRDEVSLGDEIRVVGVEQQAATMRITLQDEDMADSGTVTLVFSDRPLTLRKWELVDARGVTTEVSLLNPRFGVAVEDAAFEYQDLEIRGTAGRVKDR